MIFVLSLFLMNNSCLDSYHLLFYENCTPSGLGDLLLPVHSAQIL